MTQEKLYKVADLATLAALSRKTIWAWVRDGKLKATRYGSEFRITEADWDKCIEGFNQK